MVVIMELLYGRHQDSTLEETVRVKKARDDLNMSRGGTVNIWVGRMLRLELADGTPAGRARRRFMDAVKEDME